MGGQGLCSATTDQNKILIITSQAAKHYVSATTDQNKILIITSQAAKHYVINLLMFCSLTCDY